MEAVISIDDFESRWRAASARPATRTVAMLVLRVGDGAHETPARVELSPDGGVHGDRWVRHEARNVEAQVSLIDRRVAEVLVGGDAARMHLPGDNVVVDLDIDEASLPVGTRLELGSALVEITPKPHTGCGKFRERLSDEALRWINAPENKQRRLRGVYARVIAPGEIAIGDRVRPVER